MTSVNIQLFNGYLSNFISLISDNKYSFKMSAGFNDL